MRRALFLLGLVVGGCQCRPATPPFPDEVDCDGIDNNGDGLVDTGPAGLPLKQACPLTLGVCAGEHFSSCADGGWAACEYGPDYQVTERRCDGLDNDCDGRVDRSWTRVLLDADAGRGLWALPDDAGSRPTSLYYWDVNAPQVVALATGLTVVLPSDLLGVSPDLVVLQRIQMPEHFYLSSFLFPRNGQWVRFANDWRGASSCNGAHEVFTDGGFPRGADGGLVFLWRECTLPLGPNFAAVSTASGWAAAGDLEAAGNLATTLFSWFWLDRDGGMQTGVFDGGPPGSSGYSQSRVYPGADSLIFASTKWNVPNGFRVWRWIPPAEDLLPLATVDGDAFCEPMTDAPVTILCDDWLNPLKSWQYLDGGLVTQPFEGWPLWTAGSPNGLFAKTYVNYSAAGPDGGATPTGLASLRGGVLGSIAQFDRGRRVSQLRVHDIVGNLVLVTGSDYAFEPPTFPSDLMLGAFWGEYVCVP